MLASYRVLTGKLMPILVAVSMIVSPITAAIPAEAAASISGVPALNGETSPSPQTASSSTRIEASLRGQSITAAEGPSRRPLSAGPKSPNAIGPSAPLSHDFFTSAGEPKAASDPTLKEFSYEGTQLVALGMRYDSGRVAGGWAYDNASYSQGDSVHIVGAMDCFRNDFPDTCAYSSNGFEVGGGDANGGTGTPGFRFSIDSNHCILDLTVPSSIYFDCYAHPDRGWDTNYSYVWMSAYSGQGGQVQDLYVYDVETQWSGITPGLSNLGAACRVLLKLLGGLRAAYDQRETAINLCPVARFSAGDPIDTHSGTFAYGLLDLSMSTSAGPLSFQRYYSSQSAGQSAGLMAPGWTHNLDSHLTFGTSTTGTLTDVYFKAETANQYRFRANADGSFTAYPGVFAALTQDPGPPVSYTLVDSRQNTWQFDDQGRVLSWTNPTGQPLIYSYDVSGLLTRVEGPSGLRFLTLTYDAQGRVEQVSDQDSRQVSFGYDAAGDLSSSVDVLGHTWAYTYDSSHHLTQITDPDGAMVIGVAYDAAGRAVQQTNGEAEVQADLTFVSNTTTTVTDGLGNSRQDTYDQQNTGTNQQDPSGGILERTFDSNFKPTNLTDPAGNPTDLSWSANGVNLTQVVDAENNPTDLSYDSLNNLTQVTDARGNATTYTYNLADPDPARRTLLLSTDGPIPGPYDTTTYTYTTSADAPQPAGLLKTVTDPNGSTTSYLYDQYGQRIQMTDPLNHTTSYAYDSLGRLITVTDPNGRSDWICYDAAGRVVRSVANASGDGGTPQTDPCDAASYNPSSDPAADRITEDVYDDRGNMIAVTDPAGIITRTYYDSADRPRYVVQNLTGQAISVSTPPTYDPAHPDQNVQSETVYDAGGNAIATIDNAGIITRTYYDNLNRPQYVVSNLVGQAISVATPPTYNPANPDQNLRTETVYDVASNAIASIDTLGTITRTYYDGDNRPVTAVQNLTGQAISVSTPPARGSVSDENLRTDTTYDENGNAIAVTDPRGIITRTYFDEANRAEHVVRNLTGQAISVSTPPTFNPGFPDQNVRTQYVYDDAGNQIASIDTHGVITRTYYDDANRVQYVVRNLTGQGISISTPPAFNPANPDENVRMENVYDDAGRAIASVDNAGVISRTYYDALGRSQFVVRNLTGQSISVDSPPAYDPGYPDRNVRTETVYDAAGDSIGSIDPDGTITRTFYDFLHRATTVAQNLTGQSVSVSTPPTFNPANPDENVRTDTVYGDAGQAVRTINTLGNATASCYDAQYRVVKTVENPSVSSPCGSYTPSAQTDEDITTLITYDGAGNQKSMTDANGNQTTFSFDGVYRLETQTDPLTRTTTYAYDLDGNRTSMTDAAGVETRYEFDGLSRLTAVVENYVSGGPSDAQTNVRTEYSYDGLGNRTQIIDGEGHSTTFEYDALNRLMSASDALSHTTAYTYDAAGNRASLTDANGTTTDYAYDALHRLTLIDYPSPDPNVSFTYDAAGNRLDMADGTGSTHWVYDGLYRPTSITDPFGDTVGYAYDGLGNRTTLTYPGTQGSVSYLYDDASRLQSVTDWDSQQTSYAYDRGGRLGTVDLPNGVTSTYAYDDANQLSSIVHASGTGTLSSFDYTYDAVGNRIQADEFMTLPQVAALPSGSVASAGAGVSASAPAPSSGSALLQPVSWTEGTSGSPADGGYVSLGGSFYPLGLLSPPLQATTTETPSPTPTIDATATPVPDTATAQPTPTLTAASTTLPTATPSATASSTPVPIPTATSATDTSTPTATAAASATPSPTPTSSATPMATATSAPLSTPSSTPSPTAMPPSELKNSLNAMPLSIVPNRGQLGPDVAFHTQGLAGDQLHFGYAGLTLLIPQAADFSSPTAADLSPNASGYSLVTLAFDGASQSKPVGADRQPGDVNIYLGKDPSRWQTGLPIYGALVYPDIYPGIDLRYEGTQGVLKGTLVVSPGSDPSVIHWRYSGIKGQWKNSDTGDLEIEPDVIGCDASLSTSSCDTTRRGLVERAPRAWQVVDGRQMPVDLAYRVNPDGSIGFEVGRYDPSLPLILDPTLAYSTYLGGSGYDMGYDIETDTGGAIYVTGRTASSNFPTQNPPQGTKQGIDDAFVAKLSPDGSTLEFATYWGGTGSEVGQGIAVDGSGAIYAAGNTDSTDFPVLNAAQGSAGGGGDAFAVKFNSDGTLAYSTYLGGSGLDEAAGIAVDSSGGAQVAGVTGSSDFPVASPLQSTLAGGTDAFVASLSASGDTLTFSSYLGGTSDDQAEGIGSGADGSIYLAGTTHSSDFPTQSALQPACGGTSCGDAFVTRLDPSTPSLIFSTFLGGSGGDEAHAMALGVSGQVVVVGNTSSTDFPTANAWQAARGGGVDAFSARLAADGSALVYSTYLGGSLSEKALAVAVDGSGYAHLSGQVVSQDFPTVAPIQAAQAGSLDAFAARIDPSGVVDFSSYLGGSNWDQAYGAASDSAGDTLLTGLTISSDFPTVNPFQGSGAGQTAFISRIEHETQPPPTSQVTITYTYDPLYRLTAADYSSGEFFHYTYDAVGNRLTQDTLGGTDTYAYDIANRLTSVNGVTYTWDANGNLLDDGTSTYAYDHANRLVSVVQGSDSYSFAYSGLGDRLEQTENGTPIDYTLDLNAGLTQVLSDGTNAYLYGVTRIGEEQPGGWEYHLPDALGSVRQMADSTGQDSLAENFAPYGELTSSSGGGSSIYGFGRQQTDPTKLIFLRARYYAPSLQQFIQPDANTPNAYQPLDWNLYLYAWDNPVNHVDPSGLRALLVLACGIGTNGACESGTPLPDYDNKVPLSPFANWGHQNGYDVEYYDYNLHAPKRAMASQIERYVIQQPSGTKLILVGHSAGADAVVWAASLYANLPTQLNEIQGVMVLDMDLDTYYDKGTIKAIRDNGIPLEAFHSIGYPSQPADSHLVLGHLSHLLLAWLFCDKGINFHKYLAVDQTGFDVYMKPVLERWSR